MGIHVKDTKGRIEVLPLLIVIICNYDYFKFYLLFFFFFVG